MDQNESAVLPYALTLRCVNAGSSVESGSVAMVVKYRQSDTASSPVALNPPFLAL
jgi:hypothetical protein